MKKLSAVLVLLVCLVVSGLFAQQAQKVGWATREINTPGVHSFVFSEGFPATVEVYAFGAGGGGQGGHTKLYQQGIGGTRSELGRGAGGGGGGAVYVKYTITSPTTFNFTVGEGGAPGAGHSKGVGGSWESGKPGKQGGDTFFKIGSVSVIAQGGYGGGTSGSQNVAGGNGGGYSASPNNILDWQTDFGVNGVNGRHNSQEGGSGGKSGTLSRGSLIHPGQTPRSGRGGHIVPGMGTLDPTKGGGGMGGYGSANRPAQKGGNGKVILVIRKG